jgi:hypothetical protein
MIKMMVDPNFLQYTTFLMNLQFSPEIQQDLRSKAYQAWKQADR